MSFWAVQLVSYYFYCWHVFVDIVVYFPYANVRSCRLLEELTIVV